MDGADLQVVERIPKVTLVDKGLDDVYLLIDDEEHELDLRVLKWLFTYTVEELLAFKCVNVQASIFMAFVAMLRKHGWDDSKGRLVRHHAEELSFIDIPATSTVKAVRNQKTTSKRLIMHYYGGAACVFLAPEITDIPRKCDELHISLALGEITPEFWKDRQSVAYNAENYFIHTFYGRVLCVLWGEDGKRLKI
jgi:hypothetical protein